MGEEITVRDAPAFDFYPERWTHGTRQMTKVERCDYIDLLCHQWTEDGLPLDLDRMALLIGYKKGAQIPAVVLEKFPEWADGKRRNTKLEFERQKQRIRIFETSWRNAKVAWAKHHRGEPLPPYLATADAYRAHLYGMPETCQKPASGMPAGCPPPTTHHIERERAGGRETAGWAEKIVSSYVRRDSPSDCMQAVMAAIDGGEAAETIFQSVREVAALCNAAPGGSSNQFIPKAKTFFVERQWRSPEAFKDRWKEKRNGNQSKPTHTGSLNAPGRYS